MIEHTGDHATCPACTAVHSLTKAAADGIAQGDCVWCAWSHKQADLSYARMAELSDRLRATQSVDRDETRARIASGTVQRFEPLSPYRSDA